MTIANPLKVQKDNRLLPCPFCGNDAEIYNIGSDQTRQRSTQIKCSGCGIKKTHTVNTLSLDFSEKQVILKWNNRAII